MRKILALIVAWSVAGSVWAAPLRVVSMNVEWGIGSSNTTGFSLVARDLERIGADVVAFQELVSDYQNIQSLGSRLGLSYFVAKTSNNQEVGLLSRYPLVSQEWISTGGPRQVLLVRPDVPNLNDDPWIAVVHLKCCGDAGGLEQQTRATELYNLRAALLARGITVSSQVVILGDFNLVSDVDANYATWPFFAPASADGYFPDEEIFKLPLRHVDGTNGFTWRGNLQFAPRDMDHIMASAPLRNQNPGHEIYDPRKDSLVSLGRAKFGDFPGTNAAYSADHLPIFADLVLRDENDGFSDDNTGPSLGWIVPANSLTFVNRPVASSPGDVSVADNLDPFPVVTCYPLNPTYTTAGTKKITYLARDRHGNMATVDRMVTVAAWGQGGMTHNLQWPSSMRLSAQGSEVVYAKIYIPGFTEGAAAAPGVQAWIGFHGENTDPSSWPEAAWRPASLNAGATGLEDEYWLPVSAESLGAGTHFYASRWSIQGGSFGFGGISSAGAGGAWGGSNSNGVLTVRASAIDWANLQWPPSGQVALGGSFTVYARVYRAGVTPTAGAPGGNFRAQIGVSLVDENPESSSAFTWLEATYGSQYGNDDEFQRTLTGLAPGIYRYASRFSDDGGATWTYGGILADGSGGGVWDGTTYAAGVLTVGSTIGNWSANSPVTSELVGKYAIGGASTPTGVSESPVMESTANALSLTALVRKDDGKLTVEAEWVTDLAGGWSTYGVNFSTNGLSQPTDPGLERRKYTVTYDPANEPRKFLRLKATLAP